jgi:GAF domain-containing protein
MEGLIAIKKGQSREATYTQVFQQCEALADGESDLIANMANFAAILFHTFHWHWVGFYLVRPSSGQDQLVLGPFQGPVACTRIAKGKGVCGTSWQNETTVVVPNVDEFPGHIACSPFSKSEIVVPVFGPHHNIIAVLDIDSDQINDFSTVDQLNLERIVKLLSKHHIS